MNKEELIDMAREAGVDMSLGEHWSFFIEELEAFAKLVAEAEREACAKEVENALYGQEGCGKAAKAIRVRGEA